MIKPNLLRYGKDTPLPEQIPLRAGPLTMVFEDGELRTIKFGGYEVVRRIYAAVRDRSWGTVLPVFSDLDINIGEASFRVTYTVVNRQNEINFTWKGEISGAADGTITFRMDGQARTTFLKNRIGFCVLHPAGVAGAACTLTQVDGSVHTAAFPLDLNPDQPPLPFTDLTSMRYAVGPAQVHIAFDGDAFEMEDQRNWTDASFKTFCTPLRLPYPAEIRAGTSITQTITVKVQTAGDTHHEYRVSRKTPLSLSISPDNPSPLPRLGLGISSQCSVLTRQEADWLKKLGLDHLRADLNLADPGIPAVLRQAVIESLSAEAPLHLALHFDSEDQLQGLLPLLEKRKPEVSLWLIYPTKENYQGRAPIAELLALAKKHLLGPFAAGTDTDFIFLQRYFRAGSLPLTADLQAVSFQINPQVHAFDHLSLVETLEAQEQALQTAHKLAGDKPVMVSPITLKPRFNPQASGPETPIPPGDLPPQVDPRQMSLFTAAWTVGSIRAMALGRAKSVTYFETVGWRGVMESVWGSPIPEKFYSIPGMLFPVYHVFAALGGYAGCETLATSSSEPLKVQALAVRKDGRLRVLLANLSPTEQIVALDGMLAGGTVRILDETTFESFASQHGAALTEKITLRPYALAVIDRG